MKIKYTSILGRRRQVGKPAGQDRAGTLKYGENIMILSGTEGREANKLHKKRQVNEIAGRSRVNPRSINQCPLVFSIITDTVVVNIF